jgi:hypothetical protein
MSSLNPSFLTILQTMLAKITSVRSTEQEQRMEGLLSIEELNEHLLTFLIANCLYISIGIVSLLLFTLICAVVALRSVTKF